VLHRALLLHVIAVPDFRHVTLPVMLHTLQRAALSTNGWACHILQVIAVPEIRYVTLHIFCMLCAALLTVVLVASCVAPAGDCCA
jgi:hypothetical protein